MVLVLLDMSVRSLRPTPTDLLPALIGIAPACLCREKTIYRIAQQAVLDENHALNQWDTEAQPGERQRLKSCHSFPHHTVSLQECNFSIQEAWRSN